MEGRLSVSDRLPARLSTVAVALAAGVAGLLGSYGAAGFTPGFAVAPVDTALAKVVPGAVLTFAITVLGDLGQQLNLAFAGVLVVCLYAVLVGLSLGIGRQLRSRAVPTLGSVATVWAATAALTLQPVTALGAALAAGAVVGLTEASVSLGTIGPPATSDGNGRRRVVTALGTAVAAGAVGTVAGRSRSSGGSGGSTGDGGDGSDGSDTEDLTYDVNEQLSTAMERSFRVGDMEPAVSERFFTVDINSVDPQIEPGDWSLSVTGTVEESFDLDYDDLQEMDHEHRFITLRCVGERLNGHKTDTALWTGVPLAPLVERAAPNGDCDCVMLRADDGYEVQFPVEALEDGMLAYGMNGRPLPRGHGAPVRALVPGHWGEVNTKWVTEMEFLETEQKGYWERKGWQGTGPVKTVAKLHGRERTEDGQVRVGGHAYAGTRGISAVEVSTDGGDTWTETEITDRLPGATGPAAGVGGGNTEFAADAWRAWRHTYEADEPHEVVVRAIERDGTVQPSTEESRYPSGPSGWVSEQIDPMSL